MSAAWSTVLLGDVVRLDLDRIPIDASKAYPMVGVLSFGRGLFDREPIESGATSYRYFYRLKSDHIVMSQLFGWEGALALSNEYFAGKYVSPQFPTFLSDKAKLDRNYLGWLMRRPTFWSDLGSRASGMGDRRRTLNPDAFFACRIPLPPLDEQRLIVARIETLAAKLKEARQLRDQSTEEAVALAASGQHHWFKVIRNHSPLGDVCDVIDPNPSHRYPVYVPNDVPMITTSDFIGTDQIDLTCAKHVSRSFYNETLGRFSVQTGDVIFARKGKIGYARAHPPDVVLAMTHTLCVLKPNRRLLDPRFLLHFARSSGFLHYLTGTMNPNLGVPTLGLNVIRDASIPLPSLQDQDRIVAELDSLQSKLTSVKAIQAETAIGLDALLPAILDKAFKGEL